MGRKSRKNSKVRRNRAFTYKRHAWAHGEISNTIHFCSQALAFTSAEVARPLLHG